MSFYETQLKNLYKFLRTYEYRQTSIFMIDLIATYSELNLEHYMLATHWGGLSTIQVCHKYMVWTRISTSLCWANAGERLAICFLAIVQTAKQWSGECGEDILAVRGAFGTMTDHSRQFGLGCPLSENLARIWPPFSPTLALSKTGNVFLASTDRCKCSRF